MFQTTDWSRKKLEIADAFRQLTPLLAEADQVIYTAMIKQMGADSVVWR